MPIKIPNDLPATAILNEENIFVVNGNQPPEKIAEEIENYIFTNLF